MVHVVSRGAAEQTRRAGVSPGMDADGLAMMTPKRVKRVLGRKEIMQDAHFVGDMESNIGVTATPRRTKLSVVGVWARSAVLRRWT